MREDYAIVLDYLPQGYAGSFKKEPTVQAIGEQYFALLELVPRPEAKISLNDRLYIGPDKRDAVQYIKGRLEFARLTATARNELKAFIDRIVTEREPDFINFFNKAGAITLRQHSLELLPNIGKKHMTAILDEREKKPFESYADLTGRIKLMPDPKRVIAERIMEELQATSKYFLFVKSTPRGAGNRP